MCPLVVHMRFLLLLSSHTNTNTHRQKCCNVARSVLFFFLMSLFGDWIAAVDEDNSSKRSLEVRLNRTRLRRCKSSSRRCCWSVQIGHGLHSVQTPRDVFIPSEPDTKLIETLLLVRLNQTATISKLIVDAAAGPSEPDTTSVLRARRDAAVGPGAQVIDGQASVLQELVETLPLTRLSSSSTDRTSLLQEIAEGRIASASRVKTPGPKPMTGTYLKRWRCTCGTGTLSHPPQPPRSWNPGW